MARKNRIAASKNFRAVNLLRAKGTSAYIPLPPMTPDELTAHLNLQQRQVGRRTNKRCRGACRTGPR